MPIEAAVSVIKWRVASAAAKCSRGLNSGVLMAEIAPGRRLLLKEFCRYVCAAGVIGYSAASVTGARNSRRRLCAAGSGEKGGEDVSVREVKVERVSVISSKAFEDVVAALERAIGRPDLTAFGKEMAAAKTFADVEKVVQAAVGSSGFMEFARMDLGAVLRKRNGASARQCLRLIVGNPVIMSRMVEHVPDAGSYAPVTILVDERADGVHLSYDRMASFLAGYGSPEALAVARELDAKVERLLAAAAT
jgi:uncharacterized protein (DUF302 family)